MADAALMVTEVKRFSLHDGPGIRTTVFLAGCPLRCPWCHNPETASALAWPWQDASRCLDCGACITACGERKALTRRVDADGRVRILVDREACTRCGDCITACPSGALTWTARPRPVAELLDEIRGERPFWSNGGGVTVSGGEPLLQIDGLCALLAACRAEGIHTAIESCLAVPEEHLARALPHLDLLICDLKAPDDERHRAWTGQPIAGVLANLRRAAASGIATLVRIPCIPGHTQDEATLRAIAQLARAQHPTARIELLDYNPLPAGKYARLDRPWPYPGANGRLGPARLVELQAMVDAI